MHPFVPWSLLLPFLTSIAQANVEKTIFLGPPESAVPSEEPDIDDLGLERLSPETPVVRTLLNSSFPTNDAPDGTDSWFFLENLTPGQRYEQPTTFTLTTHSLHNTIEDPSLFSSLSVFSTARLATLDDRLQANAIPQRAGKSALDPSPSLDSVLFLRVRAVADYFTMNEELLAKPPPVTVDLILDPFLGNVFPRSLVPTGFWIVAVAVVAFFVARWVNRELGRVIDDARREVKEENREEGKKRK
ncbi:hypothetical protein N7532_004418 [Penicillium argentinense]|uniref:Protein PBN1 n=1 Tax=Penicillium argentinense TaxID=1131581 RepID=A0A9W9KEW5_9EURO|nr:uncharacterized protein N7532_004418 [Penicillium argentinense]KAJ5103889.1 hypothetical protein N7532_004418 [Penicillium argentinense]